MSEPHEYGNAWGKIAITAIISVLGTSGFWSLLMKDTVTRAEVKAIVRESGPYSEERAMILQRLDDLKKNVDELRAEIRADRKSRYKD